MSHRRGAVVRVIAAVVVVTLATVVTGGCASPAKPVEHRFVIPKGAADLVNAGKNPVVMPADLKVKVGDSITIVNRDDYDQSIGPYFVGAHSKVSQVFNTPGVLEGQCVFTGKGTFKISVVAPD